MLPHCGIDQLNMATVERRNKTYIYIRMQIGGMRFLAASELSPRRVGGLEGNRRQNYSSGIVCPCPYTRGIPQHSSYEVFILVVTSHDLVAQSVQFCS